MKLKDISVCLEKFAPLNLQESYDNSGLLIGSYNQVINTVLITLDVTEAVLNEAIEKIVSESFGTSLEPSFPQNSQYSISSPDVNTSSKVIDFKKNGVIIDL